MGGIEAAWRELETLRDKIGDRRFETLFDGSGRAKKFSVEADGLLLDYSKTQLDGEIRDALIALAGAADWQAARDAMFSGGKINTTEGRAVLHTALRNPEGAAVPVDGVDVKSEIRATLARMEAFAVAVRNGNFKGQGGAITDVVNIGIGGSDLGPVMTVRALTPYHDGPRCHFVANVDGADITDTLAGLKPETTLLIVASKSFTTIETMTNAASARTWMEKAVQNAGAQTVALSNATDLTDAFGIPAENVFGFGNWVGGRYSVWGPIGLSLMIAIGPERFREFLAGGAAMDAHFRQAAPAGNLPLMLALVGIWHHQICGYPTRAVLPYDDRLAHLPTYLQQLEMESNGKRVAQDGSDLERVAGPIIWGEPGTNGQHAFYQLIHQGKQIVPCEFMVAARGQEPKLAHHHQLLVANCLAQSEALMKGRTLEEARQAVAENGDSGAEAVRLAQHRVFPGNRPSVTLAYDQLTPFRLGQLIAAYEHRVFVEGVIMGINSFDQWGVELGKELAKSLAPILKGEESDAGHDGSTRSLIAFLRR